MNEILTILLFAIGYTAMIGLMFGFAWCLMKHQQNKNFQRFMKPGDTCKYMNDPNGDFWRIEYLVNGRAVIYNPYTLEMIQNVNPLDLFV